MIPLSRPVGRVVYDLIKVSWINILKRLYEPACSLCIPGALSYCNPFQTNEEHILNASAGNNQAGHYSELSETRLVKRRKGLLGSSDPRYFMLCSLVKLNGHARYKKTEQTGVIYKSWPDSDWSSSCSQREMHFTDYSLDSGFKLVVYKKEFLSGAEVIFCSVTLQNKSINFRGSEELFSLHARPRLLSPCLHWALN